MTLRHFLPLLLPLFLLAGCDAHSPAPVEAGNGDARARAIAGEQAEDAKIMDNARIAALQKQVNDLAAELSELRDGKQAIDTRLLEQRLAAVEQRAYARDPGDAPQPAATTPPATTLPATTPRPRGKLSLTLPPPEK